MDPQTTDKTQTETNRLATEAEMSKYGITRSTVDYFHYRDFKYTNMNDALAQAKREEKRQCKKSTDIIPESSQLKLLFNAMLHRGRLNP